MRTAAAIFSLLFLGLAQAATYSSVQEVVVGIPELSLLNDNIALADGLDVTDKLQDPSFIGTVFAPTNAVLQPIKDQLGADLELPPESFPDFFLNNDVLSTSVVPGKAYTLTDLVNLDGQTLTTLAGSKVDVTVKQGSAGSIVYINQAPITSADITAGNSIVYQMGGMVVPYQWQTLADGTSVALLPTSSADMAQGGTTTATPVPTSSGSTTVVPESGSISSGSTTAGSTTSGSTASGSTTPVTTSSGSTTVVPESGSITSGNTSTGSTPSGSITSGSTSTGSTTAGSTPSGSTPSGSTSSGSTMSNSTTAGSTPSGSSSSGSTSSGSTMSNSTTSGSTPSGSSSSGSTSSGSTTSGSTTSDNTTAVLPESGSTTAGSTSSGSTTSVSTSTGSTSSGSASSGSTSSMISGSTSSGSSQMAPAATAGLRTTTGTKGSSAASATVGAALLAIPTLLALIL